MGMDSHVRTVPMNPDCFDIITLEGEAPYRMPYGLDRLEAYLGSRFPSSLNAIRTYIAMMKRINRITALEHCDESFGRIPGGFDLHQSLETFLIGAGAERGLVHLLGSHGHILYGADAPEIPYPVHGYIMGSFYACTHLVFRGGDAFVQGFEDGLRKAGVDVFTGEEAVSLQIDSNRKVTGIETVQGSRFECDSCISTVHPQILARLLPEKGTRPAFRNRLTSLENTFAPFVVFYAVDRMPDTLSQSNFFFIQGKKSKTAPMALCAGHLAVMTASPQEECEGKKSLTAILPCPRETFFRYSEAFDSSVETYDRMRSEMAESVTSSIVSHFPELKGHLTPVETATPVTYMRYTGTAEGSIYGVRQSVRQSPLGIATSIRNLYLAGQSLIPGVMGVMASSVLAVTQIIEPGFFWNRIRECQ